MIRRARAVALDLDGTLRDSAGNIGRVTVSALAHFVNDGGKAVLATGRPLAHTVKVAELLESQGVDVTMIVCSDGASVFEKGGGGSWDQRVWSNSMIQGSELATLLPKLRQALPGITFAADCEGSGVIISDHTYLSIFADHNLPFATMIKKSAPTIAEHGFDQAIEVENRIGWVRIVAPDQALPVAELQQIVRTVLKEAGLEMVIKVSDLLPSAVLLQKAENDKSYALAHVATALGIKAEEFCTFGDETNDLGMLKWAGQSICPQNGSEKAKACATVVSSLTNDEDFIADALSSAAIRRAAL
jgi:HAD superfamily hydrolase (TIGR01484 family)